MRSEAHADRGAAEVEAFLAQFEAADVTAKGAMLREMKSQVAADRLLGKQEGKAGAPGRVLSEETRLERGRGFVASSDDQT